MKQQCVQHHQACGSENHPIDPIDENNAKFDVDPKAMDPKAMDPKASKAATKASKELLSKLFDMPSQLATTQEQLAEVHQSWQEQQQQLKMDVMAKRVEDTEQRYCYDSLTLPTSESAKEGALVEERDEHKATKRNLRGLESVKMEDDDYDVEASMELLAFGKPSPMTKMSTCLCSNIDKAT
jgi:hypothetical protein